MSRREASNARPDIRNQLKLAEGVLAVIRRAYAIAELGSLPAPATVFQTFELVQIALQRAREEALERNDIDAVPALRASAAADLLDSVFWSWTSGAEVKELDGLGLSREELEGCFACLAVAIREAKESALVADAS